MIPPTTRARESFGSTPFTAERMVMAIDPGTTESGWTRLCNKHVIDSGVCDNEEMLDMVYDGGFDDLAIEMIASYGMAVGREVFETCVWIGRFQQVFRDPDAVKLVYRRDVKLHLCGSVKAKDPNVRQAVIDLFPAIGGGKVPQIGTKSQPGPLYGVKSHAWPALAVAITAIGRVG
jgi:hypothetical protein